MSLPGPRRRIRAVFEFVKAALDAVAQGIEGSIDGMLDAAISFGGDFGRGSAVGCIAADGVAVVAAIGQQDAGIAIALIHQVGIRGAVVGLAEAQDDPDRKSVGVGAEMDFCRETTTRTAKILVLSPPFNTTLADF